MRYKEICSYKLELTPAKLIFHGYHLIHFAIGHLQNYPECKVFFSVSSFDACLNPIDMTHTYLIVIAVGRAFALHLYAPQYIVVWMAQLPCLLNINMADHVHAFSLLLLCIVSTQYNSIVFNFQADLCNSPVRVRLSALSILLV